MSQNSLRPLLRLSACYFGRVKHFWCYIMSNKSRRIYVGFADDLVVRVIQHKEKLFPKSFTARYNFDMLVHYEQYSGAVAAKMREKEIKGWRRGKEAEADPGFQSRLADLSLEWQEDPGWNLTPEAQWRLRRKPPQD